MATVGVYSVAGAIEAGLAYTVLQQLVNNLPDRYGSLVALIFGLAAVTYVRHPEGAVEYAAALGARPGRAVRPLPHAQRPRSRPELPVGAVTRGALTMALLVARDISKSFGGIVALNRLSVSIDEGEAVGLVGPNGAGQDDPFQLPARSCAPRHRIGLFDGVADRPPPDVPAHEARDRPHVPTAGAVRRHDPP